MPTPQPEDRVALGRARLAARARRVAQIRRRVVAATLAAFTLAWGVIVFDGSMGATTLASSTTNTTSTATATATAAPTTSSSSTDSSGSSSSSPPAVTTSQS
jgi:uncharacterized membrane protein YgcG